MDDVERAVVLRVKGKEWSLAAMGARKGKRRDLIETHLKPAVEAEARAFCVGFGAEMEDGLLSQFIRYSDRLLVCREEKAARELEDEFDERLEQGSDLYSDTTSMTGSTRTRSSRSSRTGSSRSTKSGSSKRSKMTHRSKRRMDRAKTSLREGGQFEEPAVMQHLANLVERVERAKVTAPPLCDILCYLGMRAQAAEIQRTLREIDAVVQERHSSIWVAAAKALLPALSGPASSNAGPGMTANERVEAFRSGGIDAAAEQLDFEATLTLRTLVLDEVSVTVPAPPQPESTGSKTVPPYCGRFTEY